ncbi:MAG: ribonuclease P protein component [Nocardioidaceae bacterium]
MLPGRHRLRSSPGFHEVLRSGRRAGSGTMVVHLLRPSTATVDPTARVGFIVNRKVGDAVTRNRVKRRVRHLVGRFVSRLPADSVLVVRVNESAKGAPRGVLESDLDSCLRRLLGETG